MIVPRFHPISIIAKVYLCCRKPQVQATGPELIAFAKATPASLNYASIGLARSASRDGIVQMIPRPTCAGVYRGTAPAMTTSPGSFG